MTPIDWREEKRKGLIDIYGDKAFKEKTADEITLEDLVEEAGIKPIYSKISVMHIVSNVFLDFCLFPKQLVLHDSFVAAYIRQYGVTEEMLKASLDTKKQLQGVYPMAEDGHPRI